MYSDSHSKKENIHIFIIISPVTNMVPKCLVEPGRCVLNDHYFCFSQEKVPTPIFHTTSRKYNLFSIGGTTDNFIFHDSTNKNIIGALMVAHRHKVMTSISLGILL